MRRLILVLFLIVSNLAIGQNAPKKVRVPSYFGFQVRPLLPTRFIGSPTNTQTLDGFTTTISQKIGYSFGGVVRVGLTKFIALETGINFNQRNFDVDMSYPDSSSYEKNDLSFVTYDIPIRGLVYIRLAEQWFMNTAIGVGMTYAPTNIGIRTNAPGIGYYQQTGLAKKINFEFTAAIGFEFRTEKKGIFYLGGSAAVPFAPIFYLRSSYVYSGFVITTDAENTGKIDGSYFAIDFKYFFPNVKKKATVFKPGPVEN